VLVDGDHAPGHDGLLLGEDLQGAQLGSWVGHHYAHRVVVVVVVVVGHGRGPRLRFVVVGFNSTPYYSACFTISNAVATRLSNTATGAPRQL